MPDDAEPVARHARNHERDAHCRVLPASDYRRATTQECRTDAILDGYLWRPSQADASTLTI